MTLPRLPLVLALAAVLAGVAAVAGADPGRSTRTVVVADAAAPRAAIAAARQAAGPHAELRLPRTPTEQLSVTHWFAARGYAIVGVDLDARVAVGPVAQRYPSVRFTLGHSAGARTEAAPTR